jgi:hypothetical protein
MVCVDVGVRMGCGGIDVTVVHESNVDAPAAEKLRDVAVEEH